MLLENAEKRRLDVYNFFVEDESTDLKVYNTYFYAIQKLF